jgi:hypothetical protein
MRSLSLAVLLLVLLVLATSSLPAQFANDPNQTATAAKTPTNPNIQPGGGNPTNGTSATTPPAPGNPNPGPNASAAPAQNPPTGQPTIPPSQAHQTPGQPPQAIQPSNLNHPANTTYH